jgi:hypothetical protein
MIVVRELVDDPSERARLVRDDLRDAGLDLEDE